MLRTVVRLGLTVACAAALLAAPGQAGVPVRGVLLEGETDLTIRSHAQDGSTIALVGARLDPGFTGPDPFIAVFNAQTGEELWRDESENDFVLRAVAIAQGRVCAAGTLPDTNTPPDLLRIRCYSAKDGTVLWAVDFDPPENAPGYYKTFNLDRSSLTLTGKTLLVRTDWDMFTGPGVTLLLDAADGSAR